MIDGPSAWFSNLSDARQVWYFLAACFFILALGMFVIWLAVDPFKYKPVRRRPLDPESWMVEPTTGQLIIQRPSADAFPPHMPPHPDTRSPRRHRAADMGGSTTMIDPGAVARAIAMVPTPPPVHGEGLRTIRPRNAAPRAANKPDEMRSLSADWRDAWIVTGAHPSVNDTGKIHLPTDRTRAWWAGSADTYPSEEEE